MRNLTSTDILSDPQQRSMLLAGCSCPQVSYATECTPAAGVRRGASPINPLCCAVLRLGAGLGASMRCTSRRNRSHSGIPAIVERSIEASCIRISGLQLAGCAKLRCVLSLSGAAKRMNHKRRHPGCRPSRGVPAPACAFVRSPV